MTANPGTEISVVLPAYLEAANLKVLLPRICEVLMQMSPVHEIIVVDTPEPRDETPAICRANGVRYLPREGGGLYGHAIRTGLKHARGHYIICMDADGSHSPDFLVQLWAQRENNDLVIASRYVPGGKTENPAILIFLSLVVNVVFRLALGLACYDVSNSFRLYRGDQLRGLDLECDNFDIVEEILVKLKAHHPSLRVREIPFTFERRKEGKTKRNLVLFAIGYVFTLCRLWRFRYSK